MTISAYTLGVLWATCSKIGDRYVVRNKDRHFADHIKSIQGGTVFELVHKRNGTIMYCIKLKRTVYTIMESLGWTGRTDLSRTFPPVDDPSEFCRAYIQANCSFGFMKNGKPRLRIHGAQNLIKRFSAIISQSANVGEKKVQCHSSGRTFALYYQSADEIKRIFDWICSGDHSPRMEAIADYLKKEKSHGHPLQN